MRILIVGAGATGQVYGAHLAAGGAEVGVVCRPRQAESLRRGVHLWRVTRRNRWAPLPFRPVEVFTEGSEIEPHRWDQIWLAVSSTALRSDSSRAVLDRLRESHVVTTTPALSDRVFLRSWIPEERLAFGMTSYLAWQTPLPGGAAPPDSQPSEIEVWLPPLQQCLFSGRARGLESAVSALERGGCPATISDDLDWTLACGAGVMMPVIAELELAGWSLHTLRESGHRQRAMSAARQVIGALAQARSRSVPWWTVALSPVLASLALPIMPRAAPLDLERYLAYHFDKVGDQTRMMLDEYLELAPAQALDQVASQATALRALS